MRVDSTHVRSSRHAYITAAAARQCGRLYSYNLGMMRPAHNPREGLLHRASIYRVGAGAAGVGNGDAAGAAAAGFGFLGLSGFRTALGGGPAG
jgi:hypothetical protein